MKPFHLTYTAAMILSVAACLPSETEENSADPCATDPNCSPEDFTARRPLVSGTSPVDGAANVPLGSSVSARFTMPMSAPTINQQTFTLTFGGRHLIPILGKVTYANDVALFKPIFQLPPNEAFIATITTGVHSTTGLLAVPHTWRFTTGSGVVASGLGVDLGTSGNFVILAKTGISTVPTSAITGDIAVSPIAASAITGFSLIADSTNVFSTCPQVTGKVYAADYAPPTPSNLTTAIGDMQLAFTDAAGRAPNVTELGAGNIGGMTLAPGVYKWGSGLLIPTNLTLTGSATAVWIFQIAQNLTISSATRIVLAGGALAKNVYWQVSGAVDAGTTSHLEGVVLSQTLIALHTGATINGRLLAQTAVTLDGSTVVAPAP